MSSLVAKRYVQALVDGASVQDIETYAMAMEVVAKFFENEKFKTIINSPTIEAKKKEELILSGLEKIENKKINNLIALLSQNNRLVVIPALAEELRLALAQKKNSYTGVIISNQRMTKQDVDNVARNLSKKLNTSISLTFNKTNYDGVKVEVKDLGIEVAFSKSLMNQQLIEHILKAI